MDLLESLVHNISNSVEAYLFSVRENAETPFSIEAGICLTLLTSKYP